MTSSDSESMATLHMMTALLCSLRRQGVLSADEIDQLLERSAWPLRHRDDTCAVEAVDLIDHTRVEVHRD